MKKKILCLILICMMFSLSGCTQYVKLDGNVVKEPTTGQSLVSNILCQPENEDVIKTYEKYNKKVSKKEQVNLEKLPKCEEFVPSDGGYEGIWSTIFIKPLSWLIIQIGQLVKNYGIAIILVTLLIRFIIFPISKKSALQSENMKKASSDIEKLQRKYKNKTSKEDQMMQAQEMMALYKKHDVNPMSGCLFAFIQMPLFFAFLESLYRIPAVFEGTFLGFSLGTSPLTALFGTKFDWGNLLSAFSNGSWIYIILPILVFITTMYSFKMNSGMSSQNPEQEKQMKMIMTMMMIFITFASFTMSVSIVIYWITGSLFTICQTLYLRRFRKDGSSKKRSKDKRRGITKVSRAVKHN